MFVTNCRLEALVFIKYMKKNLLEDVQCKGCSKKFPKVHWIAPVPESVFSNVDNKMLWIILKKNNIPIYQRLLINLSQIYWRHIFIWTGNKKDLIKFLNDLNTKHKSIKFQYQISKTSITFVDTEIYIKNNILKIYRKKNRLSNIPQHQLWTP